MENVLFVCKTCNSLFLFSKIENSTLNSDQVSLVSPIKRKEQTANYLNSIITNFSKKIEREFPICNACMRRYSQSLATQRNLIHKQILYLINQEKVENAELEPRYHEEIENIKNREMQEKQENKKAKLNKTSIFPKKTLPQANSENLNVNSTKENQKIISFSNNTINNFFIICSSFHISTSSFFGTINNLRVGYLINFNIQLGEIENGLKFICHLLNTILKSSSVMFSPTLGYISQNGEVVKIDKLDNLDSRTFATFTEQLFTSSKQLFLVAEIWLKSQKISDFNFYKIENRSIGGHAYIFNANNPLEWSTAMKRLLFNLKLVQFLLLRMRIGEVIST